MIKYFSILFLIICFPSIGISNSSIVLEENQNYIFNITDFSIFEDTSTIININEIIALNSKAKFIECSDNNKNFGFKNSAYWLHTSIFNNSNFSRTVYVKIFYPLLNDIQFFEFSNNVQTNFVQTGENFPHNSRVINSEKFIFPVTIQAKQTKEIYVRIYSLGETVKLLVEIEDSLGSKQYETHTIFTSALLYGYVLFALIFNIFLFIQLRKKEYILLCALIVCLSTFFLTIDGFAFQYLWPNSPQFSNHALIFFSMLSNIITIIFANTFLKTTGLKKHISLAFIITAFLIIIWNFFPVPQNMYSIVAGNLIVFVTVSYILVLSIIEYFNTRTNHTLLFLLAFAALLIGSMIYILVNFQAIPLNGFTQQAIKIGFALHVTLLTIATITQFRQILRDTNIFLEDMVNKRTNLVTAQNKQLKAQNERIEAQFKEIKQSIHYAKRIQRAILPHDKKFNALFEDHMILYKPKDIVSGDFYWVVASKFNKTYIAAADCTGHGVPGGFLSMLGISFLNQIITANPDIKPNEVLNKLRTLFSETLNNNSETQTRDSMDISICLFDHAKKEMEYAGAYNSILIVRNMKLEELKVDRISLENDISAEVVEYKNFSYNLEKDDKIYMFSDGYHDQFGGDNNKRLTKKRFKNILLETSKLPLSEQKKVLDDTIKDWTGNEEQLDDMLILGLLI